MQRILDFNASIKMLKKYGIKFADFEVVKKKENIGKAAKKIGFPLVEKIISPDIIHKTEKKCVEIGIKNEKEALDAFERIHKNAGNARFSGILLQKQIDGHEIIIGGKKDAQFGAVVLFGLGGIFTEILKDFAIRVAPIDEKEAQEMIQEIKGFSVLTGARGKKPANLNKIAQTIVSASKLVSAEKIKEFDLNPCFAGSECVAADVRIIL